MARIRVEFERVRVEGLAFSSIKVNDQLLEFVNDKAAMDLEPGEAFELYWRIQGAPGAKLTIKYSGPGVQGGKVDTAIPVNRSRFTAFTFITL